MDGWRKTPYRFLFDSFRDLFNEKTKEINEYYNYKKTLENGNKKK